MRPGEFGAPGTELGANPEPADGPERDPDEPDDRSPDPDAEIGPRGRDRAVHGPISGGRPYLGGGRRGSGPARAGAEGQAARAEVGGAAEPARAGAEGQAARAAAAATAATKASTSASVVSNAHIHRTSPVARFQS